MCKKTSIQSCLPEQYHDYEQANQLELLTVRSNIVTVGSKRKASERLGTNAAIAYNAMRHGKSFEDSKKEHVELSGSRVFDLIYKGPGGEVEVKEAKGGKSEYGTCYDSVGKPITQCTPEYNTFIAHKMKTSPYKGRHPTVACINHSSPQGTCRACQMAERDHRRKLGADVETAMNNGKFTKFAIRGDYNKTCVAEPEKIEAYKDDGTGSKIPV